VEITLELFATLTKYLPAGSTGKRSTLMVQGGTTVAQVMEGLGIPDDMPYVTLVNGRHTEADHVLQPGDRLSAFPPLAGGRGETRRRPLIFCWTGPRPPGGIIPPATRGEEAAMSFVDLRGRRERPLFERVNTRLAWGDRLMLSLVTLEAGSTVPMHSHPHEQAGFVLEGELDFTIGDETRRLTAGDAYIIPGNVQHGCAACAGPARVLDIFSPVREEYKT